jgi:hypothetical protein
MAAVAIWVRWDQTKNGRYFWQPASAPATVIETPKAPAPTAPVAK